MNSLPHLLESRLSAVCSDSSGLPNTCASAACDHLAAGGGRVRAHICLDASLQLGLCEEDALCLAAVCELLHNASLIQDDLLDRTPVRRGSPSVWAKFGDAVAVCTGDLMLSAAYGLLGELSGPASIAPALRLVHQRTREVILGQAAELTLQQPTRTSTIARYETVAKAKAASLLSLSLELPLLLSGNKDYLETAHEAASHFAVAYQVADDLADVAQDTQEGSSNLILLLIHGDGLTTTEAFKIAIELASTRLEAAEKLAGLLPKGCAATLLIHSVKLRKALAEHAVTLLASSGA